MAGLVPGIVPGTAGLAGVAAAATAGGVNGSFAPFGAGEFWGAANPDEHCSSCTVTGLLKEDAAQALSATAPVDPLTGDYTYFDPLFSAPSRFGTMGIGLTYDASRAIAEEKLPATYPLPQGGAIGRGWGSQLTVSLSTKATVVTVNERDGAQVKFSKKTKTTTACSSTPGFYPNYHKTTVTRTNFTSSYAYCAPRRVNAQLGYTSTHQTYELVSQSGATVTLYSLYGTISTISSFGSLESTVGGKEAITIKTVATPGTTSCPLTGEASCRIETDAASGRDVTALVGSTGLVSAIVDPEGNRYELTYTATSKEILSVKDPLTEATTFAYGTTTAGFSGELTSVTDPMGNATTLIYTHGLVTSLKDPMGDATTFAYTNTTCATPTATKATCVTGTQATTVTEADGQTDAVHYQKGLLTSDCYGPAASCTENWAFTYTYKATGSVAELISLPTKTVAGITVDPAGNVVAYTLPHEPGGASLTRHQLYKDTGGNDFNELCWQTPPTVAVPSGAICTTQITGSTRYTYNSYGEMLSSTDPVTHTTRFGYYHDGLLCWSAPPSVTANSAPQCTTSTGTTPATPAPGATTDTYNAQGQVATEVVAASTPSAATTTSTYDKDGHLLSNIPPDGQGKGTPPSNPYATTSTYDKAGHLLSVHAPGTATTAYTYNKDGQVLTETDPAGVTTTAYDQDGRTCWQKRATKGVATPTCASPPQGAAVTATYLATTSAPKKVTNPTGVTTTYTYADPAFPTAPTETALPDQTDFAAYNPYGARCVTGPVTTGATSCTPVLGDTWQTTNAMGQVLSSKDATWMTTTYSYADQAFPTDPTAVNALGRTTAYAYDQDGQLVATTKPGGAVIGEAYTKDGQVCFTGPVISAKTLTCTSTRGAGDATYKYDPAGQETQMVDTTGTTGYAHDPSGHLLSVTHTAALSSAYAYDPAGQVTCVAYPVSSSPSCTQPASATNTVVERAFNAAGQMTTMTDWLGNTTTFSGYTAQGNLGQLAYPASTGESASYTYTTGGKLTGAAYKGPVLGTATDAYSYDQDGRLSSSTSLGMTLGPVTYDRYSQVVGSVDPGAKTAAGSVSFGVDPNGQVTSTTEHGSPQSVNTYVPGSEELASTSEPQTTVTTTKVVTPIRAAPPVPLPTGPAKALALAPNGTVAYVAAGYDLMPATLLVGKAGTVISLGSVTGVAVAVTAKGTTAYVAGSSSLVPVTLSSGAAKAAISLGVTTTVHSVALTPAGTTAYVGTGSSLVPVTLSSGTAKAAISVGVTAHSVVVTPKGTTAYVAGSTSLVPVTLASATKKPAIALPVTVKGLVLTPNGTTAYVAGGTTVVPVTLSAGATKTPVTVGVTASALALNPSGTKAYVTGGSGATAMVTVVTLATSTTGPVVPVSRDGSAIAVSPSGNTAYVAGYSTLTPLSLTVARVDALTPHFGYNATGQRCWEGKKVTTAVKCTSPPAGAAAYGWNPMGELCWMGTTQSTTASCATAPSGTTTYTYDGHGLRASETLDHGTATQKSLSFTWDLATGWPTPLLLSDGTNAYLWGPGPAGDVPVEQINLSAKAATFVASTPQGVQAAFSASGGLQEEARYATYGTQVIEKGSKVSAFSFQDAYQDPSGLLYVFARYYTATVAQFISVDPGLAATGMPYAFAADDPANEGDPLGMVPTCGSVAGACGLNASQAEQARDLYAQQVLEYAPPPALPAWHPAPAPTYFAPPVIQLPTPPAPVVAPAQAPNPIQTTPQPPAPSPTPLQQSLINEYVTGPVVGQFTKALTDVGLHVEGGLTDVGHAFESIGHAIQKPLECIGGAYAGAVAGHSWTGNIVEILAARGVEVSEAEVYFVTEGVAATSSCLGQYVPTNPGGVG